MAGIVEFLGGPLFGLIGGVVTRWQDLEAKKEDNRHELKKFDFELQMRDKERIARQEEAEQNMAANQLDVEGKLVLTELQGSWDGLKASMAHDQSQEIPAVLLRYRELSDRAIQAIYQQLSFYVGNMQHLQQPDCVLDIDNQNLSAMAFRLLYGGSLIYPEAPDLIQLEVLRNAYKPTPPVENVATATPGQQAFQAEWKEFVESELPGTFVPWPETASP